MLSDSPRLRSISMLKTAENSPILGRDLAVAPTGPTVRLEKSHGRPLSRIAFIPHGGCRRGPGRRPAALWSRLVLLHACLGELRGGRCEHGR
jgi:hypothetical protein